MGGYVGASAAGVWFCHTLRRSVPAIIRGDIPRGWLVRRTNVQEVEAANLYDGIPFRYQSCRWEKLTSEMLGGDEIWEFCSPPSTWRDLCGRKGYVVARNGTPTHHAIITVMN